MAAKHKLQHSSITITSSLSPEQLLTISEEVAAALTKSKGTSNGRKFFQYGWDVVDRQPGEMTVHIGSPRKTLLEFVVCAIATDHRSKITTGIGGFRTTRPTYIGIPVGPKTLVAYPSYRAYMLDLGRAVERVDPACSVRLVERTGKPA